MDDPTHGHIACRWCGRVYSAVTLRPGERAVCTECGNVVAHRRLTRDAGLAFAATAIILAGAAANLPLVTVRKFGTLHASYLWTGIQALWTDNMPLLSVWVALCGLIVPIALLASLLALLASERLNPKPTSGRFWRRVGNALQRWSMPEVQVLAVLVAFVKIGALVDVQPGPGLWFYAGMAVATLFAWRNAEVQEGPP
jgi:paraquat-inducible protein A